MPIAVDCRYRPRGAQDRLSIRAVHLDYMIANKARVIAGGPTLRDGELVGMFLLLATDDPAQAEAFLAAEPYTRAGLFAEVRTTAFTGYLPEPHEGFLLELRREAAAGREERPASLEEERETEPRPPPAGKWQPPHSVRRP